MAKENVSVESMKFASPTEIAQAMKMLAGRLAVVRGTAVCVTSALIYQNAEADREVAACIRHNIVEELGFLEEYIGGMLVSLGARPLQPASQLEEIRWLLTSNGPSDKATRKSGPSPKR